MGKIQKNRQWSDWTVFALAWLLGCAISVQAWAGNGKPYPARIFPCPNLSEEGREKQKAQTSTGITLELDGKTLTYNIYLKAPNGTKENVSDPAFSTRLSGIIRRLFMGEILSGVEVRGDDVFVEGKPIFLDFKFPVDAKTPTTPISPTQQTALFKTFREKLAANYSAARIGSFKEYRDKELHFGILLETDDKKLEGLSEESLEQEIVDMVMLAMEFTPAEPGKDRALELSKSQELVLKDRDAPDRKVVVRFYDKQANRFSNADDVLLVAMLSRHLKAYFSEGMSAPAPMPMETTPLKLEEVLKPQVVERAPRPSSRPPAMDAQKFVDDKVKGLETLKNRLKASYPGWERVIARLVAKNKVTVLKVESLKSSKARVADPKDINIFNVVRFNETTREIEVASLALDRFPEEDRPCIFLYGLILSTEALPEGALQTWIGHVHREIVVRGKQSISEGEMNDWMAALLHTEEIAEFTATAQKLDQLKLELEEQKGFSNEGRQAAREPLGSAARAVLDKRDTIVRARFKKLLMSE